jgi:S-layer protein
MALFPTNAAQVQAFAGALYGVQVGTSTMTQVNSDINAAGGLNNALNAYYTASFGSVTTATVAASLVANIGISAANAAAATAYVTGVLNSTAANARGAAIMNILNQLAGLTADATFGADAAAWNTKVESAVAYAGASNVAFGSTVSQGSVFALTIGVDAITGTSGNDTFNSNYDVINGAHTLSGLDALDGGAGNDTLNITDSNGGNVDVSLPTTVKNIETVNVQSTSTLSGNAADVSTWAGLIAANFSVKGAVQTLTVADTTALTASNAGGGLTVSHGLSQTVTTKGGALTASGSAGAVVATSNAQAGNNATVNGGTTVSFTGKDVTTGTVTIGTTTAPSGAVTVTSTGNYTDGANVTLGDITVKGGSTISVTQASGITAAETAAAVDDGSNFTLTQSAVHVTGTSATTTVTITQDAAVTEVDDDTTGIGVIGVNNGDVDVTDVNASSATKAGTITAVTLNNFGNATLNSNALATINLHGTGTSLTATQGALTTAATTTQVVNVNGLTTTGTVTLDTDITTLNVNSSTAASTINSLVAAGATAVNVSGDANLTLTSQTLTAATQITNTSTGNLTLGSALATATAYTGGTGNDTITLAASHAAAVATGTGDDTVTIGGAFAAGGSVDAGAGGTDTLVLADTVAVTVSSSTTFAGLISNFERLSLTGTADADQTVDLANLDNLNYIKVAGVDTGNTLSLTNVSSGVTLVANSGTAGTLLASLAVGSSTDVANVNVSASTAKTVTGLTLTGFETVNFATDDSATTPTGIAHIVTTLTDANAKAITVAGDAGLSIGTFAGTALTSFDASGVTKGAVTFATANLAAAATLSGGAGNDSINASSAATAAVTLNGNDGNDTLTGGTKGDTINGGTGDDIIYGLGGADHLTGGTGADVFGYILATPTDSNGVNQDTITDFVAGTDKIGLNGTSITYLGEANGYGAVLTSLTGSTPEAVLDTSTSTLYINLNSDNVLDTNDITIKLDGITDLSQSDFVGLALAAGSTITGSSGADVIMGLGGADTLNGNAGADTISGGAGADTITGGTGIDTITTGAGADIIIMNQVLTTNRDIITDFTAGAGGDELRFDISDLGLAGGTEYVGAIGGLAVDSSDEIAVLTGVGYATDEAAETAVAGRVTTDGLDIVVVYFNTTDNTAHVIYDADAGVDGTGTAVLIGQLTNITTQAGLDAFTTANIGSQA